MHVLCCEGLPGTCQLMHATRRQVVDAAPKAMAPRDTKYEHTFSLERDSTNFCLVPGTGIPEDQGSWPNPGLPFVCTGCPWFWRCFDRKEVKPWSWPKEQGRSSELSQQLSSCLLHSSWCEHWTRRRHTMAITQHLIARLRFSCCAIT